MRKPTLTVLALIAVLIGTLVPASAAPGALPSKKKWLADVSMAMQGSRAYLDKRLENRLPWQKLAVNLDIDNTSLATEYDKGQAIAVTLRFARYAHNHGIKVFFNTGRGPGKIAAARASLVRAGFPIDRLCHRKVGEDLVHSKKRCRASFVADGYVIVANVGNRSTDFVGGNYSRAFRLPNYGNQLS